MCHTPTPKTISSVPYHHTHISKSFSLCMRIQKFIIKLQKKTFLPFFWVVRGEMIWHQVPGKTARVQWPHAWWSRHSLRTWSLPLPCRPCPSLGPSHPFPVVLTRRDTHPHCQKNRQESSRYAQELKYDEWRHIMITWWSERVLSLASLTLLHFWLAEMEQCCRQQVAGKISMSMLNMAKHWPCKLHGVDGHWVAHIQ